MNLRRLDSSQPSHRSLQFMVLDSGNRVVRACWTRGGLGLSEKITAAVSKNTRKKPKVNLTKFHCELLTERFSQAIDARSDAGGAEAIVNVDDGDVGGAGVEHAQ